MPEYQPIEPLEPMNNNPSGKSRVTMMGFSKDDQKIIIPRGSTLSAAIMYIGGPYPFHSTHKITINHKSGSENPTSQIVDLRAIIAGEEKDVILKDGDMVSSGKKPVNF